MTQKGMNSGRESQSLSALLSSFRPHPPHSDLVFQSVKWDGWVQLQACFCPSCWSPEEE